MATWISTGTTLRHIRSIDKGVPIKVLSGLHVGCLELIANDSVQSIADLKGKRSASMTLPATRTCCW